MPHNNRRHSSYKYIWPQVPLWARNISISLHISAPAVIVCCLILNLFSRSSLETHTAPSHNYVQTKHVLRMPALKAAWIFKGIFFAVKFYPLSVRRLRFGQWSMFKISTTTNNAVAVSFARPLKMSIRYVVVAATVKTPNRTIMLHRQNWQMHIW